MSAKYLNSPVSIYTYLQLTGFSALAEGGRLMPIYEYRCQDCDLAFERIQKFSDLPIDTCPTCSGSVKKLISRSAFHLKGDGWYVTDYARKGNNQNGQSSTDSDNSAGSSSSDGNNSGSDSSSSNRDSSSKSDSSSKGSSADKSSSTTSTADTTSA